MSIRDRRLLGDRQRVEVLNGNSDLIAVTWTSDRPEKYVVKYSCKGLYLPEGSNVPSITNHHILEIYLHTQYPRLPPSFSWKTAIYHPNILPPDRNGGVCIGSWSPAEGLDRLIIRIGEMVQYKSYNVKDPLDWGAALWASAHASNFPVDLRELEIVAPSRLDINV